MGFTQRCYGHEKEGRGYFPTRISHQEMGNDFTKSGENRVAINGRSFLMKEQKISGLESLLISALLGMAAALMTMRNNWLGIFNNRNRAASRLVTFQSPWTKRHFWAFMENNGTAFHQ